MMGALATMYLPAGIAIGLGSAAPVGPVNLLVIQRTLCNHRGGALLLGLGAALGDALFAIVTAFGLGAIGTLVSDNDAIIRMIGGLVMLGFAVVVWRSAPHLGGEGPRTSGGRLAALGMSMTVTNPATMFFFLGSFSAIGFLGLGHDSAAHRGNAALLVAGVFAGSMLWWLVVTEVATRLRDRVSDAHLRLLNHGTAVMLALFGIAAAIAGATA